MKNRQCYGRNHPDMKSVKEWYATFREVQEVVPGLREFLVDKFCDIWIGEMNQYNINLQDFSFWGLLKVQNVCNTGSRYS